MIWWWCWGIWLMVCPPPRPHSHTHVRNTCIINTLVIKDSVKYKKLSTHVRTKGRDPILEHMLSTQRTCTDKAHTASWERTHLPSTQSTSTWTHKHKTLTSMYYDNIPRHFSFFFIMRRLIWRRFLIWREFRQQEFSLLREYTLMTYKWMMIMVVKLHNSMHMTSN